MRQTTKKGQARVGLAHKGFLMDIYKNYNDAEAAILLY